MRGECDYLCVNDEAVEAQRGEGIYIRSHRLHYGNLGSNSALPDLNAQASVHTRLRRQANNPSSATPSAFKKHFGFHLLVWPLKVVVTSAGWRPHHLGSNPNLDPYWLYDRGQVA